MKLSSYFPLLGFEHDYCVTNGVIVWNKNVSAVLKTIEYFKLITLASSLTHIYSRCYIFYHYSHQERDDQAHD